MGSGCRRKGFFAKVSGNLTHSTDQRTGTTRFEYDKLGRITQAGNELFAFDPAHNILDIPTEKVKPYPPPSPAGEGRGEGKTTTPLSADLNPVTDNRLKTYNGTTYYYDELGNLIHRELADGEVQNYFYDLHDQLVKAEIFKKDGTKETWAYTYDALGRRIGKGRLKTSQEVSDDLENQTCFVWDGSHLLQEIHPDGRYTYIYTDPDSYEPLAQVRDWTTEERENRQETNYFHCDQIGIPREMTDKDGNLLWFGNYTGWGRLKEETKVTDSAYQPFRLQNQYADRETGLHYNFFRYYEPDAGRFVNQDPIGLDGGDNFYFFAPNSSMWLDVLGLATCKEKAICKKIRKRLQKIANEQNAKLSKRPFRGLTPRQVKNVKKSHFAYFMHYGTQLDTQVKNVVRNDKILKELGLKVTPGGGKKIPDFTGPNSACKWFDLTTKKAWAKHMKDYQNIFGAGKLIKYTRPPRNF